LLVNLNNTEELKMAKGKSAKKESKSNPAVTARNKERKQLNHAKRQIQAQENKQDVDEKIKECCIKFSCNIVQLKKRFGTLNIRRVQDILDDTWSSTDWYETREENRANRKIRVAKNDRKNTPKGVSVSEGNGTVPASSDAGDAQA
jgi:hypothetical protein